MTEIELSSYPDGVEWRVAFDGQTVAGGVLHTESTQTAWHAALDLALEQVPEQ